MSATRLKMDAETILSRAASPAAPKTTIGLVPLMDRVVLQPEEAEAVSAGGLRIPTEGQRESRVGVVVATGPGAHDQAGNFHPMQVQIGARVVYAMAMAQAVMVDGVRYLTLREADVIGLLQPLDPQPAE